MIFDPGMAVYGSALALIWGVYSINSRRLESRNAAIRQESEETGQTEPLTMHPSIDPARCVGCGACTKACPEGDVLGILSGRAELIAPTHCIGHGECAKACPVDAISLVFGTARRGVELPQVKGNFETNVSGLFIAGELGGMGLIRNAVKQGRQAVEAIAARGRAQSGMLDLVIAGAGPAGIAAALTAKSLGLNYQVIEQDDLGGAVFKYPRGKVVMTVPVDLPVVGPVRVNQISKEELLRLWRSVEATQQLRIAYRERVESVRAAAGHFLVQTAHRTLAAHSVLLATGRRGTPRRLDIPGEDLPKVLYQLVDPEQYNGQKVLVVGGGDSALEAAVRIAGQPGTAVTLSYRGEHFARARQANRQAAERLAASGQLRVMMGSSVRRIAGNAVDVAWNGGLVSLPNDTVLVCAGGVLPTAFLQSCGVAMETKYGTA